VSPGWRCAWLAAVVLVLAACASPPRAPAGPDDGPSLSGRLAIRIDGQPERSVNAGFDLAGTPRAGQLLLTGPLGAAGARARWAPGLAVLTTGGNDSTFPDLDTLIQATLGEAVPMAALFDWLQGRPWPEAPSQTRPDGQAGFVQLGWAIDLSRWADGVIEARREQAPAVTVKARVEKH